MNIRLCKSNICLLFTIISTITFAQKVKSGYDKAADFSKFRSYTIAEPATPPARPLLYANIVGVIEDELKAKGLVKAASNADLTLIPAGGMEFGLNTAGSAPITPNFNGPMPALDATMWTGAGGPSNLMAIYVPEGTLMLTFIERDTNKIVWSGTVTEKLDVEQKMKSLERINKAVTKLLQQFPPRKK
jgi:uncharacterized protein DUF4136